MKKQTFKNELHNLAETILELRELFKLSQTRFAQLLGVNRSVIASIEQEKHLPNMFVILKICQVFHITPAELMAETYADWKLTTNQKERSLLHKSLRNSMSKIVTDEAISKLRQG